MRSNEDESTFNFWPVYSDLCIVLVLLLLLLSMGLMVVVAQLYALVSSDIVTAQLQLKSAITSRYSPDQARVCDPEGSNQLIVLSGDAVFPGMKGEIGDMKPTGRLIVESIARILAEQRNLYQGIQIEGHASFESVGTRKLPKFPNETVDEYEDRYALLNWDVSASRARSVTQVFIQLDVPPEKISAAAMGHYRPLSASDACMPNSDKIDLVTANEKDVQRSNNRRINILVIYGSGRDRRQ